MNSLDKNWYFMYSLAKNYYNYHNDLRIAESFKTINGYDYCENGYELGKWIVMQRLSYKNRIMGKRKKEIVYSPICDEQVFLLNKIGMIYNVKENSALIENLCINYGINYFKYKGALNKMPYREMLCKLKYLIENNIDIQKKGEPNLIFFMPNNEFKNEYSPDDNVYVDYQELKLMNRVR